MGKFCEKCGAELTEGVLFCEKCGAPVYGQGISGKGTAYIQPESEKKKKGGKKAAIISLIAVAVILILIGTGAALYLNSDGYQARKNMELAGENYEAGEYEEALSYYKKALRLDETIVEAYLKSAEIYLVDKSYDEAIKQLKRGIKRVGDEENIEILNTKLVDVYLEKAGSYLEIPDYGQAIEVLKKGIKDTDDGNRLLTDKLVEAYLGEADSFLARGDYSRAVEILEEGKSETGDKRNILGDRLEIASCFEEAESLIDQEDYEQAIDVLKESLPDTEADLLNDYIVQLRRKESDKYLREGDCLMAVQALEKGIKDTGDSSLSEREEYLRENIVIRKERWYYDGEFWIEAEFDDSGKLLSNTGYFDFIWDAGTQSYLGSDGFPNYGYGYTDRYEYEYDGNERIIKSKLYSNNIMCGWSECEYDRSGNCVKIIDYGVDGVCSKGVDYSEERYADRSFISNLTEYEYDDAGRKTIETIYYIDYYGDTQTQLRIDFEYDEAGNEIRRTSYYYEYGYEVFCSEYDGEGNIVSEITYSDYFESISEYKYDEKGNIVRIIHYNTDGSVSSDVEYKYEYDGKGNVTKCISTGDGEPYVMWEKKYDELGNIIEGKVDDGIHYWTRECEYVYIGV